MSESEFDMPLEVRKMLSYLGEVDKTCFNTSEPNETTVSLMFDVRDHPEPDCKYALQIYFTWDIPLPGRLLCFASVGIWNPPTPEDGFVFSPFIDIGKSDEDSFHAMILRHIAVPLEVANIAEDTARSIISGAIDSLRTMNVVFSNSNFDDEHRPDTILDRCFSGYVSHQGEYMQWGDWIERKS